MTNLRPKRSDELSDLLHCTTDVLDCSMLPSGTHKILKARRVMSILDGIDWTPILISSGNYARAITMEAERVRRKVIIVLDTSVDTYKPLDSEFVEEVEIRDLIAANAELAQRDERIKNPQDLTGSHLGHAYEYFRNPSKPVTKYKFSTKVTDENRHAPVNVTNSFYLDHLDIAVNNGGIDHLLDTYGQLAVFLKDYDAVFCPVGSGELFYDLFAYSPCHSVDFYGVIPERHPALIKKWFTEVDKPSLANKLTTPVFPISSEFNPGDFPLSMPYYFMDRAKKMEKCFTFVTISEEEIAEAHKVALTTGFDAESSGSVGFASTLDTFREKHDITFSTCDRLLIVNTGNGNVPTISGS